MVVAVSVRLSEGKTMASYGCGSGLRQGLVQGGRQRGATRVQERREQGTSKMWVVWP